MFECPGCDYEFYNEQDCYNHIDDYDHWAECDTCDRQFRSERAAEQHMDALDHWALFECETCTREFGSEAALDQHMRAKKHFERYCPDCDREFYDSNGLHMHLNSSVHRGTTVTCPFCKSIFVAASGASTHLESGACPQAPRLSRETIFKIIRENDCNGTIMKRLLEWKEDQERAAWEVNSNAHNGNYWECYFCHKEFDTAASLKLHLNSPVHKQKIYHCPNKRESCGKEFTSLAALFAHLESESCRMMRFENVQRGYQEIVTGISLISS